MIQSSKFPYEILSLYLNHRFRESKLHIQGARMVIGQNCSLRTNDERRKNDNSVMFVFCKNNKTLLSS
jgi:hypothetical protein